MNNIVLITVNEPFYIPVYYSKIIKKYRQNIKGAIILKNSSPFLKIHDILLLAGPINFMIHAVKYIYKKYISNILHKVIPVIKTQNVQTIFKDSGIPLIDINNPNSEEFKTFLKKIDCDIIISAGNNKILDNDIINMAKLGILNVHTSLLPAYKGILTAFWTLYNNEKESGVTINTIEANGIDNGRIVSQKKIDINNIKTMHQYYTKCAYEVKYLLVEAIEKLLSKDILKDQKNTDNEKLYSIPNKEEMITFRKKGFYFC